jgi:hypothetical protein
MDGWDKIPRVGVQTGCDAKLSYYCVSGYTPSQVPNSAALAGKFAISDMTFSMSDSPSWEGHIYAVAASTDGFWGQTPHPPPGMPKKLGWGCESDKIVTWFSPASSASQAAYRTARSACPTAGRSSLRRSATSPPSWTGWTRPG